MEVLRLCPLAIAQRLVHCTIDVPTAVLDRVTKTMSVAQLLMNNLDNSKQKTSNLLSPAPSPYSWSLLGKCEGPAPPPSSKISWSFDLAWNPVKNRQEKSLKRTPAVGVTQMQKLRSLCWEHRTVKIFPLKPGVGQNTATHASPAAWDFLLVLISTLLVHSPTLSFSTAYILNCISCA